MCITTPWDLRLLRRSFASLLLHRFPLSLSLAIPRAHTSQKNDIVFLNDFLTHDLTRKFDVKALPPIVNVGHHNAHAAIFFVSPFEEALVLVMDGYGDDCSPPAPISAAATGSSGAGRTELLQLARHASTPSSPSTWASAGFGDEGKVMALAACGEDTYVERFSDVVRRRRTAAMPSTWTTSATTRYGQLRPFKRKFLDTFGPPRAARRAPHRPPPRPGLRAAGRDRGDRAARRARAAASSIPRAICA